MKYKRLKLLTPSSWAASSDRLERFPVLTSTGASDEVRFC